MNIKLARQLGRLALAAIIAHIALGVTLLLLFTVTSQNVRAAPSIHPLAAILTGTTSITHTSNTTHEMRVFGNGGITNRFMTDDGTAGKRNQIDQDGLNPDATTIAVLFDDTLDVGVQGNFSRTIPITLNTTSSVPGYSEDSNVIYASKTLSYQITQRTLATTTNNCVIMELGIKNTGSITPLTGGKLLYMVDIDVAHSSMGDNGFYDASRHMVYLADYNNDDAQPLPGYAMGISLLQGNLRGYAINGTGYPTTSLAIKQAMITPTNTITDGDNNVVWLVANIPDLAPSQDTMLVFSLCSKNGLDQGSATDNLADEFDRQISLAVLKTALPNTGFVVAGETITYSITISSTGNRYVDNIVVTDTIPASTNLITYNVTQGSITANNNLITATIGRLYPASNTVTVTIVAKTYISATSKTITNQAFVNSEPIVTATNLITHQLINEPGLTVTKFVTPSPTVQPGERLTYTIIVSSSGQGFATNVLISDTLPANTKFVTNSINLSPMGNGTQGVEPPVLASDLTITAGQNVTVTFAVTVTTPISDGTIITNTASVTSAQTPTPATGTVTTTITSAPILTVTKSFTHPIPLRAGNTITYTIVVSNSGNANATGAIISDTQPADTNFVAGSLNLDPISAGTQGSTPPILAEDVTIAAGQNVTVTFAVTVTTPISDGTFITNTVSVTSAQTPTPVTDTVSTVVAGYNPTLAAFISGPGTANVGETIVYTFTIVNYTNAASLMQLGLNPNLISIASLTPGDGTPISLTLVTDDVVGGTPDELPLLLNGGDGWRYAATYTMQASDPDPLENKVFAEGLDLEGDVLSATSDILPTYKYTSRSIYLPIILKNN